jgi:hypothetical protein
MFRWGTGWSAAVVALLWILAGIFLLDVIFELQVLQRAVVIVVGLGLLAWAISKFTSPYLGSRETEIDMALMVERQQGIDSDLVAALQFEDSPEAAKWGSRELEDAVIDYVAQLDRGLNVFEGFSRETFWKRMGLLAATLVGVIAFVAIAPDYASAFLNRLALGNRHYPSDTAIDRVIVNGAEVLELKTHGTSPVNSKSAQGESVLFAAWASGKLPADTEKQSIYLFGTGPSGARKIDLAGVTRDEFEKLYEQQRASAEAESPAAPPADAAQSQRMASIVSSITPVTYEESKTEPTATNAAARLKAILDQWPKDAESKLYVGKLPRLLDEVKYQIYLGDAWTDPATIKMVGLPVVVPTFTDVLPEYARAAAAADDAQANAPTALQRSVIEGSTVKIALSSNKPLQSAMLTVVDVNGKGEPTEFPLQAVAESDRKEWNLPATSTPLTDIRGPVRFELQVVDEDDLSLESPLRGYIRLKADRAPRITGGLVHRVVLPTASPEVELRASDDFGIAALHAKVEVAHRESKRLTGNEKNDARFTVTKMLPLRGTMSPKEAESRVMQPVTFPVRGENVAGAYVLNLSSLKLARGDEVRITLQAQDYRGDKPGVVSESEPIVLEITDESGILAAVSEGDRRSQEQIDDLIRRQLGIGSSPKQ